MNKDLVSAAVLEYLQNAMDEDEALCPTNFFIYLLLLVCEIGSMLEEAASSLQLPLSMFPSPSSPSTYPGGQYTDDSVHRRKLWRATAAFAKVTTFSGFAWIGLRNSLHLRKIIIIEVLTTGSIIAIVFLPCSKYPKTVFNNSPGSA